MERGGGGMEGEIKIFCLLLLVFGCRFFFFFLGGGEEGSVCVWGGGGGRWSLPFCDIGSFTCIFP